MAGAARWIWNVSILTREIPLRAVVEPDADPDLRGRMSRQAAQVTKQKFTLAAYARSLLDALGR